MESCINLSEIETEDLSTSVNSVGQIPQEAELEFRWQKEEFNDLQFYYIYHR